MYTAAGFTNSIMALSSPRMRSSHHITSSLREHWLNCLPVGYVMYFLTYFKGGPHRFLNLSSCNWSSLMFMKDWHSFSHLVCVS